MILQRCNNTALFIKEHLVLSLEGSIFGDLSQLLLADFKFLFRLRGLFLLRGLCLIVFYESLLFLRGEEVFVIITLIIISV